MAAMLFKLNPSDEPDRTKPQASPASVHAPGRHGTVVGELLVPGSLRLLARDAETSETWDCLT